VAIKEFIIGPQNYFEEGYFSGDYTHPNVSRAFLQCDVDNIKGGRVVTGEYYLDNYIDGTYYHNNGMSFSLSVDAMIVQEATVGLQGYYSEGYYTSGYYEQRGSFFVLSAELEIVGEDVFAEADCFSQATMSITANKIVDTQVEFVAEFTQTATISHIEGADLFAFAEAQLAIEVSLIRDSEILTSSVFDTAIDFIRFFDGYADAQAEFGVDATAQRGLEFDLQTEAAFSFDATVELIAGLTSDFEVQSELTATISHIQGADIVVDGFAQLTADIEVIYGAQAELASEFNQVTNASSTKTAQAEFVSIATLNSTATINIRNVNIVVNTGGRFDNIFIDNTNPKFGQGSVSYTREVDNLFPNQNIWNTGSSLAAVKQGYSYTSTNGTTWTRQDNNLASAPRNNSLNFANGVWFVDGRYSTNLTSWNNLHSLGGLYSTFLGSQYRTFRTFLSNNTVRIGHVSSTTIGGSETISELINTGLPSGGLVTVKVTANNLIYFYSSSYQRRSSTLVLVESRALSHTINELEWDGNQTYVASFTSSTNSYFLGYSTNGGANWTYLNQGTSFLLDRISNIKFVNGRWFAVKNGILYSSTTPATLLDNPVETKHSARSLVEFFGGAYLSYTNSENIRSTDLSTFTQSNIGPVTGVPATVTYTPPTDVDYTSWKTIDFWHFTPSTQSNSGLINLITDDDELRFVVQRTPTGTNSTVRLDNRLTGSTVSYPTSGVSQVTLAGNTWNHFRISRDSSNLSLYLNGTRFFATSSFTTNLTSNAKFVISTIISAADSAKLDELLVSSSLLTSPSSTSFTPPTLPWKNNEDTLLLVHFNEDFSDDSSFPVIERAALTVEASITASLRADYDLLLDLASESTLSAQVVVDRSSDIVAFSNAELIANIEKISGFESQLLSEFNSVIEATNLANGVIEANSEFTSTVEQDRIRDNEIITDSIATAVFVVVKIGNVLVSAEVNSELTANGNLLLEGQSDFASEFTVIASGIVAVDGDADLSAEASVVADNFRVRFHEVTATAEFNTEVNAGKIVDNLIELQSEFSQTATATGTIDFEIDLNDAFNFGLEIVINRGFDIELVAETAIGIETNNSLILGASAEVAAETNIVIDNSRTRETSADLPSISTKLVAAAVTTNTVTDILAEFAVVADVVRVRDNEITAEITSEINADVVKTAVFDASLDTEASILANGTSSTDASAFMFVETSLEVVAQKSTEIILSAFSNAAISVDGERLRDNQIIAASQAEVNVTPIKIHDGAANLNSEANVSTIATRVLLAEADLQAFNTTLTIGRVPAVDRITYKIPAETRIYKIASETRDWRIAGETRIYKIRSK
jgi:hypothetical protein